MREYTDLEVLQMIGRAGRPQFDTLDVGTSCFGKNFSIPIQRLIPGTFQRSS
jgi:replicative superfamily II helicase